MNWLGDYVDLSGIDPAELGERMTVHVAEVDGVDTVRWRLDGIVAALVQAVQPIDGRLASVMVDVGGRSVWSVCGAPGVRAGQVVAAALPGARLADGAEVAATVIGDRPSEAVLVSPAEIGFSEYGGGLLALPAATASGTPLARLAVASDMLIDVENKSLTHRPDLWGHYGIAREVAAIIRRELRPLPGADLSAFDGLPEVPISREDPEDCPFYGAIRFAADGTQASPLWVQQRLGVLGLRSRGAVVDASNYVQFDTGQPVHAFDGDRLAGVRVARSGRARRFPTLDGTERPVQPEDLLIFDADLDADRPVAIAGVMGGAASEVTHATRRVLLESASFRAARVRATSVRLALRTDASLRFEKKLPSVFAQAAPGRLLHLLGDWGVPWQAESRFSASGTVDTQTRIVALKSGFLDARAGTAIPGDVAVGLLTSIGFGVETAADGTMRVEVPPFRSRFDIQTPEDIGEEVMRLYGYDEIEPVLPAVSIVSAPINDRIRHHHRSRRVLSEGHGFIELHNYSWFSETWNAEIGYAPGHRTLDLVNPVASDRFRMRDTLLPSLLAVCNRNRRNAGQFRIYELGRKFWLDDSGTKLEAFELAGILVDAGDKAGPAELLGCAKRAVADVALAAGRPMPVFGAQTPGTEPWSRTTALASVTVDGVRVGTVGMLPQALRPKVADAGRAAWFSLDIDGMGNRAYPELKYVSFPVHPGSSQDFTIPWPTDKGYAVLAAVLDRFSHPHLVGRDFVGVYVAPGATVGRYTVRFHVGLPDRTPTHEHIQAVRDAFLHWAGQLGISPD